MDDPSKVSADGCSVYSNQSRDISQFLDFLQTQRGENFICFVQKRGKIPCMAYLTLYPKIKNTWVCKLSVLFLPFYICITVTCRIRKYTKQNHKKNPITLTRQRGFVKLLKYLEFKTSNKQNDLFEHILRVLNVKNLCKTFKPSKDLQEICKFLKLFKENRRNLTSLSQFSKPIF